MLKVARERERDEPFTGEEEEGRFPSHTSVRCRQKIEDNLSCSKIPVLPPTKGGGGDGRPPGFKTLLEIQHKRGISSALMCEYVCEKAVST